MRWYNADSETNIEDNNDSGTNIDQMSENVSKGQKKILKLVFGALVSSIL